MKLSGKDILLVFGIIVAIIVTLTTIAYSEQSATLPKVEAPLKKASIDKAENAAAGILRRALDRVSK